VPLSVSEKSASAPDIWHNIKIITKNMTHRQFHKARFMNVFFSKLKIGAIFVAKKQLQSFQ
jgi:hypothetical protein